jgi:hypothetical protein
VRLVFSLELVEPTRELGVFAMKASQSTNARMISMFAAMAREVQRTLDSMATPCSVKAKGGKTSGIAPDGLRQRLVARRRHGLVARSKER